jgi:tRNA/rRNA methyltransferase
MSLENCRVVLVRTEVAENLGATARIMRNMGLSQLVLVSPVASPADRQARRLSTHGEAILEQARLVAGLGEAVADCVLVAATSARSGGLFRQQSAGAPHDILPRFAAACVSSPVALVFGPEPTGLTNVELSRCHYLIQIPAEPSYPALNLAQAVAICLYELRRLWLEVSTPSMPADPPAPFVEQERAFAHLRMALEEIHFLYGPKADSLMHAVRHLLGRAQPSAMEIKVLIGLARQIRWYVRHGPRIP